MRDLKAPDAACIRGFEIHMGIIDAMTVMNINAMRWTFHFHAFYIIKGVAAAGAVTGVITIFVPPIPL